MGNSPAYAYPAAPSAPPQTTAYNKSGKLMQTAAPRPYAPRPAAPRPAAPPVYQQAPPPVYQQAPPVGAYPRPGYSALSGPPHRPNPTAPSFPAPYGPSPYHSPNYSAPMRQAYAPPFSAAPTYLAPGQNAAVALDAADGVLDGRFFGSNIAVQGAPTYLTPPQYMASPAATAAPTYSLPAFTPTVVNAKPLVAHSSHQRQVPLMSQAPSHTRQVQHAPDAYAPTYTATYTLPPMLAGTTPVAVPSTEAIHQPIMYTTGQASNQNALALDAADGIQDGRFFGAPIFSAPSSAPVAFNAPVTGYLAQPATPQPIHTQSPPAHSQPQFQPQAILQPHFTQSIPSQFAQSVPQFSQTYAPQSFAPGLASPLSQPFYSANQAASYGPAPVQFGNYSI